MLLLQAAETGFVNVRKVAAKHENVILGQHNFKSQSFIVLDRFLTEIMLFPALFIIQVFFLFPALISESQEIIQPFILGCDTKNPRIVQICMQAIQRLICHEALSAVSISFPNVIHIVKVDMRCQIKSKIGFQPTEIKFPI